MGRPASAWNEAVYTVVIGPESVVRGIRYGNLSAILVARGALAAKMARRVPEVLDHPHVGRRHLDCLHQAISGHSRSMDQLVLVLRQQRPDHPLLGTAESIQWLWQAVLHTVDRRLATSSGMGDGRQITDQRIQA